MRGHRCVREGIAATVGRDQRYYLWGNKRKFYNASELIRRRQPGVPTIDLFLEDCDGIRWIKDLLTGFLRIRILFVSGASERIYAGGALDAGAPSRGIASTEPLNAMIVTIL
jgi:DNA-binding NarL/FixJ family response regulator